MKRKLQENIIPADIWFSALKPLLDEGHQLRISPSGLSMYPFLVGGRDEVFLRSTAVKKPVKGDIALFRRPNGMHVLHRVHHIDKNQYFMLGDAQTSIEGPIDKNNIIAVAEAIIRKNKKVDCNNLILRALSIMWMSIRPIRPFLIKLKMSFNHSP